MTVTLTQDGPIARVTLRRPEARNAITIAGWHALAETIGRIDGAARVVLLAAEGSTFCAGADLRELASLAGDVALRPPFREAMRAGIEAVACCPVPVVASIGGGAFGAGVALALACDLRVATPRARFAIPPARFGISYPQPDIDRLIATVGRSPAARLLLAGVEVDAAEAARIGLVDSVADDGGEELAEAIAANVPESVALLRRQIAGMAMDEADRAFEDRFGSEAFAAVAAGILAR